MNRGCLAVLLGFLLAPLSAQAAPSGRWHTETPEVALSWVDNRLTEVEHALHRIETYLDEDLMPRPVIYPLMEIRNAQTACETLQGELRHPQKSWRVPVEMKRSQSSRKAVQDLCLRIAQQKNRIQTLAPVRIQDIAQLQRQSEEARSTIYYSWMFRTNMYLKFVFNDDVPPPPKVPVQGVFTDSTSEQEAEREITP
ncbi:MAG: hypothetical protein CMK09_10030 [Ponticaulis sp.]|nr:hypothetical protein [Ponticaulis sp.]|tara:strand:+ start:25110 stop:25700 length:591 start_codon:yes stop_codon:yes gene_type:complete